MKLTAKGPAARGVWKRVLAQDPDATISQTPAWMDCLSATGHWTDVTRAYLADDGRELVLPLAGWRSSDGASPIAASMPFGWGTGGVLCLAGRLSATDVAAVVRDLYRERPVRATLRPSPAMEPAWTSGVPEHVRRTRHMSQSVGLADGFSAVSGRFSSSVRRNVHKAERGPITVEWDEGPRLIPVFDALYRISVARWAERQHEPRTLAQWRARRRDPPSKFWLVAERLGAACRVGVAWRAGQPAAAIIVLTHAEHSTYWRGAMDQALAARTGANELLHWMAIKHACRAGHRWYHMGDSAPASSLAEFKRRFGAEAEHYTGYRLERWPLSSAEELLRTGVKRLLRFRD